jgi:hypothetical protein
MIYGLLPASFRAVRNDETGLLTLPHWKQKILINK